MSVARSRPVVYDLEEDFFKVFKLQQGALLGTGMRDSSVLLATSASGRQFAAKKLSLLTEDGGVQNQKLFEREIHILQNISHSHVVRCLLAARCPQYVVICTQFCPNGTLRDGLENMTKELCGLYFVRLACAVRYLNHRMKIVHCDVKLENIFIDSEKQPVLGDFGLSFSMTSRVPVRIGGTSGYRAPELLSDTVKSVDPIKLDVYSLGVVLWSMTCQVAPTEATSYKYLDLLKPTQDMDKPLKWCLKTMLDTDHENRPDIKQVLDFLHHRRFHSQLIDSL